MRALGWLAAALALGALGVGLYVRLAPDDAARWHVDPTTAPTGRRANAWRVGPPGGAHDAPAPVFAMPPAALAAALDRVALAAPRTVRLAGGPEALHATYVQRSRLWGFPDYVSVRFLDAGDGRATLAAWSRARYGHGDLGVNRARLDAWLAAVAAGAAASR